MTNFFNFSDSFILTFGIGIMMCCIGFMTYVNPNLNYRMKNIRVEQKVILIRGILIVSGTLLMIVAIITHMVYLLRSQ